ncbi:hypothetical protein AN619_17450 [Thermotalea metallivorans]|uniref:Uncharacterized protein n=1 Tax=Thermotalea metallivorans TaxID=520762 RepID=A0A140L4K6_9FIRM|nr:hypothetical protein AN619_17450 [Thermotalea metallivorans]
MIQLMEKFGVCFKGDTSIREAAELTQEQVYETICNKVRF